jgi:primosomal replication protein N
LIIVGTPKAWITMAEGILECVIQHRGTNVEKGRLRELALKIQAAQPGQSNVEGEAGGTDRSFGF